MKRFLLFLSFLTLALGARAQFSPGFTNAKFSGSANSVLSGATFGIASGGTLNGAGTFNFSSGTLILAANQVPWADVSKSGALLSDLGGLLPGASGGTGVANTGKLFTMGGNVTFAGAFPFTGTVTASTAVAFPTAGTLVGSADTGTVTNTMLAGSIAASKLVGNDIATVGTVGTGTWQATVVAPAYGGTGVNNGSSVITIGGNTTLAGAFNFTGTVTANTTVTFPVTGTLATLAGAESLTNKKLGSLTTNGVVQTSGGDGTLSAGSLTAANGGTGQTTYTKGDLLVALNSTTLAKLGVGSNGQVVTANSTATNGVDWEAAGGTGTITGPGSSANNDIVTWNGTTGLIIKDASGLTASSGAITATATNGSLTLNANGTGGVVVASSGTPTVAVLQIGGATTGSTQGLSFSTDTPIYRVAPGRMKVLANQAATIGLQFNNTNASGYAINGFITDLDSIDNGVGGSTAGVAGVQRNYYWYDNNAGVILGTLSHATGNLTVLGTLTNGSGATTITNAAGLVLASVVVGTATNDSATAGRIGEYATSVVAIGSAVSLTNVTAANITSISLTAGDWDVSGIVNFTETTSTVTGREAGISSTTATLPTDGSEGYCGVQSTVTSETNSITLARKRLSLSGTTTIYLVGYAAFSAGTCGGFGALNARRVR